MRGLYPTRIARGHGYCYHFSAVADDHDNRVKRAVENYLQRRRQPRPRPAVVVVTKKKKERERVRVPFVLPDHKCAVCGAEPHSGVTLPGDSVVYFCDKHLRVGRNIAEKAWRQYKLRRLIREVQEAYRERRDSVLEREYGRLCPFCGVELVEELTHEGKTYHFCPSCDTEFYDTTGDEDAPAAPPVSED